MLRDRKGYPRLEDIKVTWADRMKAEAKAEARIEESLRLLSRQMEARFGVLSEPCRRKLEEIVSDDLAVRLLDAHSLEELGLA